MDVSAIKPILMKLLLSSFLLLMPIRASLIAVIFLTAVDLISGIWAARSRKEKITSDKLKRTLIKLFVYEVVLILAFVTEQYLVGDLIPLVKIIGGFIGITELKSLLENAEEITGLPLFKLLIEKLANVEKQD